MRRLEASNSIFAEEVAVKQRQEGCIRFSYLPHDSLSPRRFHCHPDMALAAAREKYGAALSEEERMAIKNAAVLFLHRFIAEILGIFN